jgi:hypothetical protein
VGSQCFQWRSIDNGVSLLEAYQSGFYPSDVAFLVSFFKKTCVVCSLADGGIGYVILTSGDLNTLLATENSSVTHIFFKWRQ